jgi:hypothetical protein
LSSEIEPPTRTKNQALVIQPDIAVIAEKTIDAVVQINDDIGFPAAVGYGGVHPRFNLCVR